MNVVTTANPSLRDAPWKGTIVGYYRGLVSCATATLYPLLLERNCRDFHDSSPPTKKKMRWVVPHNSW